MEIVLERLTMLQSPSRWRLYPQVANWEIAREMSVDLGEEHTLLPCSRGVKLHFDQESFGSWSDHVSYRYGNGLHLPHLILEMAARVGFVMPISIFFVYIISAEIVHKPIYLMRFKCDTQSIICRADFHHHIL